MLDFEQTIDDTSSNESCVTPKIKFLKMFHEVEGCVIASV